MTNLPADPKAGAGLPAVVPALSAPAAPADKWTEPEERGPDLRRYLAAVMRHKWLVLALAVVGLAGGYLAGRFQAPQYAAQATIIFQNAGRVGDRGGPITQGQLLESTAWRDLLRSFVVLDEVVRTQRLFLTYPNPEDSLVLSTLNLKDRFVTDQYRLTVGPGGTWSLAGKTVGEIGRGGPNDSIGANIGIAWVAPHDALREGHTVEFSLREPREVALGLANNLNPRIALERANFMTLTLTGPSGRQVAATLNAIADRFVDVAAQLKREKLTEYKNILYEQLQNSRVDLEQKEIRLENFRVETITLPSDPGTPVTPGLGETRNPVFARFFTMRIDRENLRRDRQILEQAMTQSPDSASTILAIQGVATARNATELERVITDLTDKRAQLRTLLTRYSPDHQTVQRLNADMVALRDEALPLLTRSLVNSLREQEDQLDQLLGSASRELREIPARSIEEERLRRDRDIAATLYTRLQQAYEEARLAELSSVPDARVLDRAVRPSRPLRNVAPLFLFMGLGGGLALGIAGALLMDHFDKRLRYPDQVQKMGLTILGTLPRVRGSMATAAEEDLGQVVESLRTIRLNVVHAYGAAGPLVTTVTSPGAGDGKSFLASNLAMSFAEAGHRTVLIDGDIRRGSLHRVLGTDRKPGLLDHLSGTASREEIVRQAKNGGFDFIPSGTRRSGGPELLASPAMAQLLAHLRTSYSVVICDSAPLGAGVDPMILGSLTGNLLLVLREGVTDRELASVKLDLVDRLPIRVLGAVLNDVKPSGIYKYYAYLPGYGTTDEAGAEEEDQKRARIP